MSLAKKGIIYDNDSVFKRLGRVSHILPLNSSVDPEENKKSIKIDVDNESVTLFFDKDLDLGRQQQKISKRISDLSHKLSGMESKLKNKSFLKNAPKQIINNEKKALIVYKSELKKLISILNSIKN